MCTGKREVIPEIIDSAEGETMLETCPVHSFIHSLVGSLRIRLHVWFIDKIRRKRGLRFAQSTGSNGLNFVGVLSCSGNGREGCGRRMCSRF